MFYKKGFSLKKLLILLIILAGIARVLIRYNFPSGPVIFACIFAVPLFYMIEIAVAMIRFTNTLSKTISVHPWESDNNANGNQSESVISCVNCGGKVDCLCSRCEDPICDLCNFGDENDQENVCPDCKEFQSIQLEDSFDGDFYPGQKVHFTSKINNTVKNGVINEVSGIVNGAYVVYPPSTKPVLTSIDCLAPGWFPES